MSKYTTGEMAKLCGVSVRTVQYYDTRKILTPSELSEGGRRMYTEDDLHKLEIICFLRELDLPINSIGELFLEEHPENVISILLEEQKRTLQTEMAEKQQKLNKLEQLNHILKTVKHFSVESIGDAARIMKNKQKLQKARIIVTVFGIIMDIIEIGALIFWIHTGNWIPFALAMPAVTAIGIWMSTFYFRRTAYICPDCHAVFIPAFKQALWAKHTPNTRKLTCTACGYHGFCVETYREEAQKNG